MITKEEYVLRSIISLAKHYLKTNEEISPSILLELIKQWDFDYEMEKEYRPEVLEK